MTNIEQTLQRIETLLTLSVKEVLNTKEAAAFLGKSESRIRHLVADREIPHYRSATDRISFRKSELEEWRLGRKQLTQSEIESEAATHIALRKLKIS